MSPTSSLIHGPDQPPLLALSLGALLEQQERQFGDRDAIICPETSARLSYRGLNARTKQVARALVAHGVRGGDRIGIFSGNCERYVELFFAAGRIGAVTVVLNNTYTEAECLAALRHSGCRLLFTSTRLGRRDLSPFLKTLDAALHGGPTESPFLREVVLVRASGPVHVPFSPYEDFVAKGQSVPACQLEDLEKAVDCRDVCNFQFTSGTTGDPKAAMLSHYNIVNNGNLVGDRLCLTERDIICCPPPLFHCFGLVLGLLACITHGASIVFPSSTFDPVAVIYSLVNEKCTGLHGVPTMLVAVLEKYRQLEPGPIRLRTGIAAGASVPAALLEELHEEFGLHDIVVTYGMTETSPASFMSSTSDPLEAKLMTVGRPMPHTAAKVVDSDGNVVPRGTRGELCISGYLLQRGYFNNVRKTDEVMRRDSEGRMWMHTGDEAILDADDYCRITGRIKDIIIRGGENIYPVEVEERLDEHPAVSQSSVVGLNDKRYGEMVAAFLQPRPGHAQPSDAELASWVKSTLGSHKAPAKIFWMGFGGVPATFPATGSGKVKKTELAAIGNKLVGRVNKL
ncbi:hypothetical protein MKZ38_010009 [Zalerion maritima]|uniref:Uncharacterized protein n=1 Tax=Zalerion maritima TaxID=339359 RepID=A0AAD5RGJ8_9PEZI|nr:hypothetical protein MKZ38_010009 [Zalerion maritima]